MSIEAARQALIEQVDTQARMITRTGAFIVIWRGKQLQMPSGKMVWNTKGAAAGAFANAFKDKIDDINWKDAHEPAHVGEAVWGTYWPQIVEDLKQTGILEIRQISNG